MSVDVFGFETRCRLDRRRAAATAPAATANCSGAKGRRIALAHYPILLVRAFGGYLPVAVFDALVARFGFLQLVTHILLEGVAYGT